MSVNTTHKDYDRRLPQWERVRDVVAGSDAVKAKQTEYLPKLGGQDWQEYLAYLNRADFHGATGRTLDGLSGALFRKPPALEAPDGFGDQFGKNVNGRGTPFTAFAKTAARETVAVGRYGVLVDVPVEGGDPYQVGYRAENILNWRQSVIAGVPTTTLVVLREISERPDEDGFAMKEVERFRVLQLAVPDNSEIVRYAQSVWEKPDGQEPVLVEGPIFPTRRGEMLGFIPFQFVGPSSLSPATEQPPLLALADTNLSHYRTSADLEHGAHWTALPTPWVSGALTEDGSPLRIGSTTAWMLSEDGQAGMLEFTGAGLEALEKRLERKEKHMAVLGARLLEDQKIAAEAAETVSLRHRGENSVLASIADTLGRALTATSNWQWWWAGGGEEDISVAINDDFIERRMTPQEMVQLVAGWQQGGYGGEVLFHNLREGERIPPGWTLEDWQKDIEENGPAGALIDFADDPGAE